MRWFQCLSDFGFPQMRVGFRRQRNPHSDYCIRNFLSVDRPYHRCSRVDILSLHRHVYGDKHPGIQLVKLKVGHPLSLWSGLI